VGTFTTPIVAYANSLSLIDGVGSSPEPSSAVSSSFLAYLSRVASRDTPTSHNCPFELAKFISIYKI
jgi:hypothetical protein